MFQGIQRMRAAIDSRIAEEQARQKAVTTLSTAPSRSVSRRRTRQSNSSPSRRTGTSTERGRKLSGQLDPSEFENPLRLSEDGSSEGRSRTDSTAPPSNVVQDEPVDKKGTTHANDTVKMSEDPPELPADVKVKLRRLDRIEAKYKDLLAQYRVAFSRANLIEPFEQSLREVTPFVSVGDPAGLVGFINQLSTKADLALAEFKNVSAERNELAAKVRELEKERELMKEEAIHSEQQRSAIPTLELPQSLVPAPATLTTDDLPKTPAENQSDALSPKIRSASSLFSRSIFGVSRSKDDAPEEPESAEIFDFDNVTNEADDQPQLVTLQEEVGDLKLELEHAQSSVEKLNADLSHAIAELRSANSSKESLEQELIMIRNSSAQAIKSSRIDAETRQAGKIENLRMIWDQQRQQLEAQISDLQTRISHQETEMVAIKDSSASSGAQPDQVAPFGSAVEVPATPSVAPPGVKKRRKNKKKGPKSEEAPGASQEPALEEAAEIVPLTGDKAAEISNKTLEAQQARAETEVLLSEERLAHESLRKRWTEMESKRLEQSEELKASQEKGGLMTASMTLLMTELERAKNDIEEIRKAQLAADTALRSSQSQAKQLQEKAVSSGRDLQTLQSELSAAKISHESSLRDATATRTNLESKIELLTASLTKETAEREALSSSHQHQIQELSILRRERLAGQELIDQMNGAMDSAHKENESLREETRSLTAQKAAAERTMSGTRDANAELSARLAEAGRQCESLEEEAAELQQLLREQTRENEALRRTTGSVQGKDREGKEIRDRLEMVEMERDQVSEDAEIAAEKHTRALKELQAKADREAAELEAARRELSEEKSRATELRDRIEILRGDVAEGKKALEALRKVVEKMQTQHSKSVETQRKEFERRLEEKEARYLALQVQAQKVSLYIIPPFDIPCCARSLTSTFFISSNLCSPPVRRWTQILDDRRCLLRLRHGRQPRYRQASVRPQPSMARPMGLPLQPLVHYHRPPHLLHPRTPTPPQNHQITRQRHQLPQPK